MKKIKQTTPSQLGQPYAPPLTRDEVLLLTALPHDYPAAPATPKERLTAKRLVALGLLETDPSSPKVHFCTGVGQKVVDAWYEAGWLDDLD